MPAVHMMKRGDTRPYHNATLTFADGSVQDLTGHTVQYKLWRRDTGALVIDLPATITDAVNGVVEFQFTLASQTDDVATYYVEWVVTFADTTVQTFPTVGYDIVKIIGDLR